MVAPDAFEACDDVLHLHAGDESADALQIAVASAIELHVADNAVLHLHVDVARANALGFIGCFHNQNNQWTPSLTFPKGKE